MSTKLEAYNKEIKKFLLETYNMDVLKLQKPNETIETFNDVYMLLKQVIMALCVFL